MGEVGKEIAKSVTSEMAGTVTELAFSALVTAAGFPSAAIALPLAKGLVLGLVENCYNDCAQRTLSIRETKKLNRVSTIALETFRELAEKDGVIIHYLKQPLKAGTEVSGAEDLVHDISVVGQQ